MPRVKHHRSSRRVPPPKDSDFDHEIKLVDHSPSPRTSGQEDGSPRASSRASGEAVAGPSSEPQPDQSPDTSPAASKVGSKVGSQVGDGEVGSQVGDGEVGAAADKSVATGHDGSLVTAANGGPSVHVEGPTPQAEPEQPKVGNGNGNGTQTAQTVQAVQAVQKPRSHPKPKSPESEIDILYENQRGGFLCGMPLFSSKALGNLDPPAWTNYAHKPSPTDIHTAQVPDPSWDWAWPEWRVNHEDGVDEDGWEYSFMFARMFSWHKAGWWNSFVRRRAWIRKRVKKDAGYVSHDPHMLSLEYFSIRPSAELERSPSRASRVLSNRGSRVSVSTGIVDQQQPPATIERVDELLQVLRASRIDREKIEAVDNYLANAEDELAGLQDVMHEVMSLFVFQASRRLLLTRLTEMYDKAAALRKKRAPGEEDTDGLGRKVDNLAAAVGHADGEVRRLEYWSDVRGVAAEGESKGAVDVSQGWDPGWQGLDNSGPKAPGPPEQAEPPKKADMDN